MGSILTPKCSNRVHILMVKLYFSKNKEVGYEVVLENW